MMPLKAVMWNKVKKRCGHDDMSAAGSVVGGILYE